MKIKMNKKEVKNPIARFLIAFVMLLITPMIVTVMLLFPDKKR